MMRWQGAWWHTCRHGAGAGAENLCLDYKHDADVSNGAPWYGFFKTSKPIPIATSFPTWPRCSQNSD